MFFVLSLTLLVVGNVVGAWQQTAQVCSVCKCLSFIGTIDCEGMGLDTLPSFDGIEDVFQQINFRENPLTCFDYRKISLNAVRVVNLIGTNITECQQIKYIPEFVTIRIGINCRREDFGPVPTAFPSTASTESTTASTMTSKTSLTTVSDVQTDTTKSATETLRPVTFVTMTSFDPVDLVTDNFTVIDTNRNYFTGIIITVTASGMLTLILAILLIIFCARKQITDRQTVISMDSLGRSIALENPYFLEDDEIVHYSQESNV